MFYRGGFETRPSRHEREILMKGSKAFEELLGAQVKLQYYFWIAMTASISIHIGVAYGLVTFSPIKFIGLPDFLPAVLFGVALLEAVLVVILRRYRLKSSRLAGILSAQPDLERLFMNSQTNTVDPEKQGKVMSLSENERQALALVLDLSRTNLICLAINESTVVMGLLVAVLRQSFSAILPFAILGLCLNLIMIPRTRDLLTELA